MRIEQYTIFLVMSATYLTQSSSAYLRLNETCNVKRLETSRCSIMPSSDNRTDAILKQNCCNETITDFRANWALNGKYLTVYLLTLKTWNCSAFADECEQRSFAVNEFTSLVYTYFCNTTKFYDECYEAITELQKGKPGAHKGPPYGTGIGFSELSVEQILEPCVQVASYDSTSNFQRGDFHEIVEVFLPYCEFVWCGFEATILAQHHITPWHCMSTRCKAGIVIDIILSSILAIFATIANITVLAVYYHNAKFSNNQALFKMSLAAADLLTGVVIFPTIVSTSITLVFSTVDTSALTVDRNHTENALWVQNSGGSYMQKFSISYLNYVGFCTVIAIAVSGYTLIMASVDRCLAMYKPLKYSKTDIKVFTKWSIVAVWLLCIGFGVFPMIMSTIDYSLDASFLVTIAGNNPVIFYLVAFALPLVVLWGITVLTYLLAKRFMKVRRQLTTQHRQTDRIEERLSRTLILMVAAFSFSITPVVVVLVASFFLSNIYFQNRYLLPNNPTGAIAYNSVKVVAVRGLLCNSFWNVLIYSVRNEDFLLTVKERMHIAKRKLTFSFNRANENRDKLELPTQPQPKGQTNSLQESNREPASLQTVQEESIAQCDSDLRP